MGTPVRKHSGKRGKPAVAGSLLHALRKYKPEAVVVVGKDASERPIALMAGRARWEKTQEACEHMLSAGGGHVELRDKAGRVLRTWNAPRGRAARDDEDELDEGGGGPDAWDAMVPARLVRDLVREMALAMDNAVKRNTDQADRLIAHQNEVTGQAMKRAAALERMSANTLRLAYDATLQGAKATAVLAQVANGKESGDEGGQIDQIAADFMKQFLFGNGAAAPEADAVDASDLEGADSH